MTAEQEILDRQDQWMDAVKRNDMALLEEILGSEYQLISARLGFVDRKTWMDTVPHYDIEEFEYDSQVNVYGDTAVVNSHYRQKATVHGQDLSVPFLVTDVWVKRDGRWQIVTRHSSIPAEGTWTDWKGRTT